MNVSYQWLTGLIDGLTANPREVADRLAMLGAPVDEVIDIGAPLRDILIARVEHAQRHPNADRLSLCVVDAGGAEPLRVVCGAPNVRAGAYYPFAPVGAALPDGTVIRRAKIRGEESQGMLCSARELGLGRDHEGILELHGSFETGRSFIAATGLDDVRLVVDVTPNRPDLLSHYGVAREIAAAEARPLRLPPIPASDGLPELASSGGAGGAAQVAGVRVTIEDTTLCARYLGLIIRGVTVGPSPEWLASRMRAIGLRPISNVVDATNYVLHELGQPLHAFDLDRVGAHVVIRRARAGERIVTLDGVERALAEHMLVIADAERPVAVAGVMGGADTEVQSDTRNILLECALFAPASVRATRRGLGLSTDASYRFERGVDPDTMVTALRRAAELIAATAGGTVDLVYADAGSAPPSPSPIRLRLARVEQVLGRRFTGAEVGALLRPLGFEADAAGDAVVARIPGHRSYDVAREEDLIEEIARRHGYDAFADELRPFRPSSVPSHPLFALEHRVRTLLVGRGFMEARTGAFAPESEGAVSLLNPLAATEGRLRGALLPGLLRRVEFNFARGARSIRLFELGTVFAPGGADGLPVESTHLALAFTGLRQPAHWSEPEAVFDQWDLKALAQDLADLLGLVVEPGSAHRLLDAGLSFTLRGGDNQERGRAGRVLDAHVDAPAWADPVWALELDISSVAASGRAATTGMQFRALPQHPPVERDLALLVAETQPSQQIEELVRAAGGPLLESVDAFDVYGGTGVPEGQRSIAYRLRFRAPDRTLTDAEVDTTVRRVLQRLNDEAGVRQRA